MNQTNLKNKTLPSYAAFSWNYWSFSAKKNTLYPSQFGWTWPPASALNRFYDKIYSLSAPSLRVVFKYFTKHLGAKIGAN